MITDEYIYKGNWVNDQKSGYGQYFWPDGAKYEGEFCCDQKHGKGIYTYASGDTLTGVFENDRQNGTYVLRSGNDKF